MSSSNTPKLDQLKPSQVKVRCPVTDESFQKEHSYAVFAHDGKFVPMLQQMYYRIIHDDFPEEPPQNSILNDHIVMLDVETVDKNGVSSIAPKPHFMILYYDNFSDLYNVYYTFIEASKMAKIMRNYPDNDTQSLMDHMFQTVQNMPDVCGFQRLKSSNNFRAQKTGKNCGFSGICQRPTFGICGSFDGNHLLDVTISPSEMGNFQRYYLHLLTGLMKSLH